MAAGFDRFGKLAQAKMGELTRPVRPHTATAHGTAHTARPPTAMWDGGRWIMVVCVPWRAQVEAGPPPPVCVVVVLDSFAPTAPAALEGLTAGLL